MLDCGKARTCADLKMAMRCDLNMSEINYLILVGMTEKILVIWFPRDDVCKPGAQLGILFVARNFATFETEAGVDAEALIIQVSGSA